jgi:hypothetical protein
MVCRYRRRLLAKKETFNERLTRTLNMTKRNQMLYQIKYVTDERRRTNTHERYVW